MAQINNNAESLSRELRKFKNLKSIDFKGLLSGTPESFVNLYRFLFCENSIGFSHFVVEKGYDLSGLNDYKFMEAVYRMMRDLLNAKPPINQNQFFSPGFTQRKLEMSTIIAAQVRKLTNEISNKTGKKTVQTTSLMKSSLKRPSSAQKQTRVTELGDESDSGRNKNQFKTYNKVKSADKYNKNDRKVIEIPQRRLVFGDNSRSSDELSDESDVAGSYNCHSKVNDRVTGNNYDIQPKILVEKADTTSNYTSHNRINENPVRNNYDITYQPLKDNLKYSPSINYKSTIDSGEISAFETNIKDNNKYNDFNSRSTHHHDRMYDMKQYAPSQHKESLTYERERQIPDWEKVLQQFDTVLARITLLEGRMQRIESKVEHSSNFSDGSYHAPQLFQGQANHNNSEYVPSYNHSDANKPTFYFNKNKSLINGTKEAIPDFESNAQHLRTKLDSDRSYSSSTYSTNFKPHIPTDYNYSAPRYVTNFSNYSEKRNQDSLNDNGARNNYPSQQNASNPLVTEPYQHLSNTYKSSQPLKISNGIPPLHPKTTKQSDEKVFSQTDRIASMLSDTQKMLHLSDEEL